MVGLRINIYMNIHVYALMNWIVRLGWYDIQLDLRINYIDAY